MKKIKGNVCPLIKIKISSGNKNNEVGLEENYKPQVWRVYKRKRGKGMKEDELAKRVMRST